MDAPIVGQDGRGSIFCAPRQLPDLLQMGVVEPRTVVEALVTLFEHRPHDAAISSPAGVVVDLRPGLRGPDEDLQGVRSVLAFPATGHVPLLDLPRLFQEWTDVRIQEDGVSRQANQNRSSFSQGVLRRQLGERLQLAQLRYGYR